MLKKIIQLALIGIVTILLLFPTATISAQDPDPWVIVVNSAQDLPDFAHNSVCDSNAPDTHPECTLRAAIREANLCDESTCPGGVMIQVPSGIYTLTIFPATIENDLATGDLDISNPTKQIIIEGDPGNPPVIDANFLDRVFDISGESVVLRNLIITGGYLVHSDPVASTSGAGIRNSAISLELSEITLEDNHIICVIANCSQAIGGGMINYWCPDNQHVHLEL